MGPSEWISLASLLVALLTAGGSGLAYRNNKRESRAAGEKAERATAAAERSALALERTAQAAELTRGAAARSSEVPRVAWRLRHAGSDVFILENAGAATAYDVTIDPLDEHVHVNGPEPGFGVEVGPNEDVKFYAAVTLAARDDRLLISWLDHPEADERHEWRRNLPPS